MSADLKTKQANYDAALNELNNAKQALATKQAELEKATKAEAAARSGGNSCSR